MFENQVDILKGFNKNEVQKILPVGIEFFLVNLNPTIHWSSNPGLSVLRLDLDLQRRFLIRLLTYYKMYQEAPFSSSVYALQAEI